MHHSSEIQDEDPQTFQDMTLMVDRGAVCVLGKDFHGLGRNIGGRWV
jgi:hypothetical protein